MSVAYVDTSALVAIGFNEPGASSLVRRIDGFSQLLSSNLLEAELRAAFARERLRFEGGLIAGIRWILPDRPLTFEIMTVLEAGYLRGADLWHVATALYIAGEPGDLTFVTLDDRQEATASALGFQVARRGDS